MSLTDLLRTVRGACACNDKARGDKAPVVEQARETETETEMSQLPPGITRAIDVSHLPPPLPMVRILETLRELGAGETLLVHHTRRPIHLYPKLDALGCSHQTSEPEPGKIEVRITKPAERPS